MPWWSHLQFHSGDEEKIAEVSRSTRRYKRNVSIILMRFSIMMNLSAEVQLALLKPFPASQGETEKIARACNFEDKACFTLASMKSAQEAELGLQKTMRCRIQRQRAHC